MLAVDASRSHRRAGRADALLSRLTYRRAVADTEREQIFRLRYDAYQREGAIHPRADARFCDPVDEQENTFLYGVYVDEELAGSIRLNVTLPGLCSLPTAAVFPEIVAPRIEAGCMIVDPTRFVAKPGLAGRYPELPYLTLRLAWLAMEHFDGDYILLAVRPEHRAFYRRYWSATEVCEARTYPKLTKPVGLSVVDYRAVRDRVLERYGFLASSPDERAALFDVRGERPAHDLLGETWQIDRQPAAELNLSF